MLENRRKFVEFGMRWSWKFLAARISGAGPFSLSPSPLCVRRRMHNWCECLRQCSSGSSLGRCPKPKTIPHNWVAPLGAISTLCPRREKTRKVYLLQLRFFFVCQLGKWNAVGKAAIFQLHIGKLLRLAEWDFSLKQGESGTLENYWQIKIFLKSLFKKSYYMALI